MAVLVLLAKASVAAMLLVSGGAKLAGLAGFAVTVRLLLSSRVPRAVARATAAAAAAAELALGAASLAWPAAGWLNTIVFAFACCFAGISGLGYIRHRGRPCACFGSLSSRRFDAGGLARSAAVVIAAGLGTCRVPPVLVGMSAAPRVLLFLAGALVALGAFSAARALSLVRELELEAS
jgi:hypothetical protein